MTPEPAGQELGTQPGRGWRRVLSAELVISLVLLGVFIAVYLAAQEWPTRTKLFPVIVAVAGGSLARRNVVLSLLPRRRRTAAALRIANIEITDEDEEEDQALEYVFETATRGEWIRVLAWVAGFFLALYFFGAVATIPVFTLLYLLVEARASWIVSVAYAAILGGLIYAAREALNISLPVGYLFGG